MEAERPHPRRNRIKTLTEKTHEAAWRGLPTTPEQYVGAYAYTFSSLEEGFQNTFEDTLRAKQRFFEIKAILRNPPSAEERESQISELKTIFKKCNELSAIPMNVSSSVNGGVYPRQVNLLLERDLFNQDKIAQAMKEGRDFFLAPSEIPDNQRQPDEFYSTINALTWGYSQAYDAALLASNLTGLNTISKTMGDMGYCGRLTLEILSELKEYVSQEEYERLFLKLPHKLAFNNDNFKIFYAGRSLDELEVNAATALEEFTKQSSDMNIASAHFENFLGEERLNNVTTVVTILCSSYVGLRRSLRTPEEAVADLHANALRLGQLTERAADNLPSRLIVDHPLDSVALYDNLPEIIPREPGGPIIRYSTLPLHERVGINYFSQHSLEKLDRWRARGGRCPMRHEVALSPGPDNYIALLPGVIEKEHGVRPPIINKQNQLHPGALNFTIGTMMAEMQGLFPALERFVSA